MAYSAHVSSFRWLRSCAASLAALVLGAAPTPAHAWTFDWIGRVALDAEGLSAPTPAARLEAVQQLAAHDLSLTEPYLLVALQDIALEVRLDAARALGRGGSQRAVPALIEWLGDPEVRSRLAAAKALGEIGGAAARSALVRSLGDSEHNVRQVAVRALGAIGKRGDLSVVTPLVARLSDDKADVRREAVEQLEALADRRALIPLVASFSDNHPEVRKAAVRAVGRFGDVSVVPALARLLRDPSEDVRSAAVGALGAIGSPFALGALTDLLASGSDPVRNKVAYALGQIARAPNAGKDGEEALDRLVSALATPSLRNAASEALRIAGQAATPALLRHLGGKLGGDPTTAVRLLAQTGDARATQALTAELERRRVAAPLVLEALGATGDPEALVPVLGVLASQDPQLRLAAMNALRPLLGSDGRASDILAARLADSELEVQVLAAEYLGVVRAKSAVPALLELVKSEAPERLRRAAVDSLGEIGDPAASTTLLGLIERGPATLRGAAAIALAASADGAALPALTKLLASPDPEIRHAAARAAAGGLRAQRERPSPAATAALGAVARATSDSAGEVAVTAIATLAASGGRAAATALEALAASAAPDRRGAAVLAAADVALGSPTAAELAPRAMDLALAALASTDDRVSADAAWAAGSLASLVDAERQRRAWDRLAYAAGRGGWATAVSASAALAKLAPQPSLTAEHHAALHLLSRHRSRLVRGNIGRALLSLPRGASAELQADLGRLLAEDPSPGVRATLARTLAARSAAGALPAPLAQALAEAAKDRSSLVRSAATDPRALGAATPTFRVFQIVSPEDEDAPVPVHPYFLIYDDLLARGAYTDVNGELCGERMPSAEATVLPASREQDG